MIRHGFLIFLMIITAGLGPALAQSYYIKPDSMPQNTGKAPDSSNGATIYNKAPLSVSPEKGPFVKYKDKLQAQSMKKDALLKAGDLAAWQESGLKPQNAAEIMAVAKAHRAVSEALMMERREQLLKILERDRRNLEKTLARNDAISQETRGAIDLGVSGSSGDSSGDGKAPTKKPSAASKLYVKPEKSKAAPKKVFTKYN